MPDSATLTTPSGIARPTRSARSWSTSKVQQVALVDTDEGGADGEGGVELRLVVDLDEHGEAEIGGQGVELGELGGVEGGHDEQHGVGAHQAGVGDVAGVDGEVLAHHRQRRRGPGRAQVVGRPGEELLVGEHREAGRAPGLVGRGQRRRVEVGGAGRPSTATAA